MAEQQYQHEYTQFYVERMQNGTLSLENVQAYERGVKRSIEQFGDDTGRETTLHQSICEALTVLQS
jgi:hypothetical protein